MTYKPFRLHIKTHHDFDFLLMLLERSKGGYLSDEYRESVRRLSSDLKFHRDSTGYKKTLE